MSTSKFDELVAILSEDYNKTYEYLRRNCKFIEQLTQKLDKYLGCGLNNLFFYTSEGGGNKIPVQNNLQELMTVKTNCYFEFRLLIKIKVDQFSRIYDCGPSFVKNNLPPPSQVVLLMAINQQDENLFIVVAPTINEKGQVSAKSFNVNPTIDDSWIELFESCFKVMKKTIEGGLEKRIRELGTETDNASQQAFVLL
jgi:hypothetical protein